MVDENCNIDVSFDGSQTDDAPSNVTNAFTGVQKTDNTQGVSTSLVSNNSGGTYTRDSIDAANSNIVIEGTIDNISSDPSYPIIIEDSIEVTFNTILAFENAFIITANSNTNPLRANVSNTDINSNNNTITVTVKLEFLEPEFTQKTPIDYTYQVFFQFGVRAFKGGGGITALKASPSVGIGFGKGGFGNTTKLSPLIPGGLDEVSIERADTEITTASEPVSVAWSEDGNYLANSVESSPGEVVIYDADTFDELTRFSRSGWTNPEIDFDHNNNYLAVLNGNSGDGESRLEIINQSDWSTKCTTGLSSNWARHQTRFSTNDDYAVETWGDGTVDIIDTSDCSIVTTVSGGDWRSEAVQWSDNYFMHTNDDNKIHIYDSDNFNSITNIVFASTDRGTGNEMLALSKQENFLAFWDSDDKILIHEVGSWDFVTSLSLGSKIPDGESEGVCEFTRDGQYLIYQDHTNYTIKIVDTGDAQGNNWNVVNEITKPNEKVNNARISPVNDDLAYCTESPENKLYIEPASEWKA